MIKYSLLERVSNAEQGSAELDEMILDALGWEAKFTPGALYRMLPAYQQFTRVFDAALTLRPAIIGDENGRLFDWQAGDVNAQVGGTPFAKVGDIQAFGYTPTLAMVLASLCARLAEAELREPGKLPEAGGWAIFLGCRGPEISLGLARNHFRSGWIYKVTETQQHEGLLYIVIEGCEGAWGAVMFGRVEA